MLRDFRSRYSELSNEELLQLACDRASLTDEAVVALDAEMRQRNLTQDEVTKHERFVKKSTLRESRKRRRKLFGTRRNRESWVDGAVTAFWSLLAFALIAFTYAALPQRYHFSSDWQNAAKPALFATVAIVAASGSLRKRIAFWISLVISSTMHTILLHMWIVRDRNVSVRQMGTIAVLLGIVLFFFVYGCGFVVRRKLYGEEATQD